MCRDVLRNSWVDDGRKYPFPMFWSMCLLKCMSFSLINRYIYWMLGWISIYAKANVLITLLCYGMGGWTLRWSLHFFSILFQFLKVDISFVSVLCREWFKCCNLIQRALYCSFVAMALYVYWSAKNMYWYKYCIVIVKATSFYRTVMHYFTWRCFEGFLHLKLWYKSCGIKGTLRLCNLIILNFIIWNDSVDLNGRQHGGLGCTVKPFTCGA